MYPHDSVIGIYFVDVTFLVPESSTAGHNQKRLKFISQNFLVLRAAFAASFLPVITFMMAVHEPIRYIHDGNFFAFGRPHSTQKGHNQKSVQKIFKSASKKISTSSPTLNFFISRKNLCFEK